jgi:hypothetical protein
MCSKDSDDAGLESVTPRRSKSSAYMRTAVQHQHQINRQPNKPKLQNKTKQSNQRKKELMEIKLKPNINGIVEGC